MNAQKRIYLQFSILFLIIVGLILAGIFFFKQRREIEEIKIRYRLTKVVEKALPKIQERFVYGDIEETYQKGGFECPKEIYNIERIDPFYFRCNPNYLQCFFQKRTLNKNPYFNVKIGDTYYQVHVKNNFIDSNSLFSSNRYYKVANLNGKTGVILELGVLGFPRFSFFIFLESICKEIYLPQRAYGHGPYDKTDDIVWDNIGQDIYVDKFLVTVRDVAEWLRESEAPFITQLPYDKDDPKEWPKPATGLTAKDMEAYCAFHGKQLMESHVYDAASFYPLDLKEYDIISVPRSPYPFQRYQELVYREKYLLLNEKERSSFKFSRENCREIYSKECLSLYDWFFFDSQVVSFIGMAQTLGGVMEYTPNLMFPRKNLNLSSFYFPITSSAHQLGHRAYWDGEGSEASHFNIDKTLEDEMEITHHQRLEVGFRCMRMSSDQIEKFGGKRVAVIAERPAEAQQEKRRSSERRNKYLVNSYFQESLYQELISTYKLTILNPLFWGEKGIVGPALTWFPLAKFETFSNNYCLYYKFPSLQNEKGEDLGGLKMIPIGKASKECHSLSFLDEEADILGISNAKFIYNSRSSHVELKMEDRVFDFLLGNLQGVVEGEKDFLNVKEKFRPHLNVTQNIFEGVWILGINIDPKNVSQLIESETSFKKRDFRPPCGGRDQPPCFRGQIFPKEMEFFCHKNLKIYPKNRNENICL